MFKKIITFILAVAFISFSVPVYSGIDYKTRKISQNLKFAQNISNNIKNHSSDDNYLRIIGKYKNGSVDKLSSYPIQFISYENNSFFAEFSNQGDLDSCMAKMEKDPSIIFVQQDCEVSMELTGNLESIHMSWGAETLKIDYMLEYLKSIKNNNIVKIALVDSGIANLRYFDGKIVKGYDFIDNDDDASNDTHPQSHGTFLASIIADCTKDTNIVMMPVRVLASKTGSLINVINGIYFAADNNADIINVSIGGELNDCSAFDAAIEYAKAKSATVVVSSGNQKMNTKYYCPAHIETAVVVSSVDCNLNFSERFSNYGNTVDMVAPGENILGYDADGQTTTLSGTSMSAAFVSACAALLKASNSNYTPDEIQQILKESCLDLGEQGFDDIYGYGVPQMNVIAEKEEKKMPTSISVVKAPNKTVYSYKGENKADLSGIVLRVDYSDGTSMTMVDDIPFSISNINTDIVGYQQVNITYDTLVCSYDVLIRYTWWQWIIIIFLFGWIWY